MTSSPRSRTTRPGEEGGPTCLPAGPQELLVEKQLLAETLYRRGARASAPTAAKSTRLGSVPSLLWLLRTANAGAAASPGTHRGTARRRAPSRPSRTAPLQPSRAASADSSWSTRTATSSWRRGGGPGDPSPWRGRSPTLSTGTPSTRWRSLKSQAPTGTPGVRNEDVLSNLVLQEGAGGPFRGPLGPRRIFPWGPRAPRTRASSTCRATPPRSRATRASSTCGATTPR